MSPVLRWLLGGALVAVLGVAGCCGFGAWRFNKAVKEAEKEMVKAQANAEAQRKARTVMVSAEQLLKEFRDDPDAADKKYKDKCLEISGVVERNGMDGVDTPFVILHAGDENAKIKIECFFDIADEDEENVVKRLRKGQTVTLRGEYEGRVSNVQIRECVLVK